jgi:hypothetical protein
MKLERSYLEIGDYVLLFFWLLLWVGVVYIVLKET